METLVQQFIKAFGWSILNSLWQSAIIYGLLFIVLFSLPKMGAKYKHNLAFVSIVAMFGSFCYNFAHHLVISSGNTATSENKPFILPTSYLNQVPPSFSAKAEQYFPIIVLFYLVGVLLQLFVITKGYYRLNKYKNNGLSNIPQEWHTIFEAVVNKLSIRKKIQFEISSLVNVPLVIGYLKPIVLFPLALVNQLETEQVEAILIHELSHIRRNDFLLNLIKTAIETVLFFNPFVWLAGRFIHIEREHACDDLVLKLTGKPLNYAHALLKLELLKDKNSPAYALAATGKSQNLYQRIKRITNMKTNYLNAKQQMAALTLGLACLFSIAWINPSEKKEKTQKRSTKITFTSNLNTQLALQTSLCNDTSKKNKIKIVTVDANGTKKEYNSVAELPDSLKKTFYTENINLGGKGIIIKMDSNSFHYTIDTAVCVNLSKKFESPEWKAQIAKIEVQAKAMDKKMNSPEWKAKIAKMEAQAKAMDKRMNSPEWKAKMAEIDLQAKAIDKRVNSPEFKMMIDSALVVFKSPEFKKMRDSALVIIKSPEFSARIADLSRIKIEEKRLSNLTELKVTYRDSEEFRNSQEYKKLKEKFEQDVKALKEKQATEKAKQK
ncbi:M56 family metallopeptidase [Pedobacter sp. MW01-1-1]|uniref:M56 family metallopeptidase n=1 Tax=Pedobacter sp. MW01-1-1 TaxID=3383027 RepID=UPI003FEF067A